MPMVRLTGRQSSRAAVTICDLAYYEDPAGGMAIHLRRDPR
jgi:hypothetical protein